MKGRVKKISLGLVAITLLVLATTRPAAAVSYIVTNLGALPGHTFSTARNINNASQVVGWSWGNAPYAFLWQNGTMTNVGALSSGTGYAYGINNVGQVVGTAASITGWHHAFLWQSGVGTADLGTFGGPQSIAYDINDSGQVVGQSMTVSSWIPHAFLWQSSVGMTDLGTLGGIWSEAHGINNVGQVVGFSNTALGVVHAFLWQSSVGMTDLGWWGGPPSYAYGINNVGQVVGRLWASWQEHAFLWESGAGMIDLGTLGGDTWSEADGINDVGQVVGRSSTAGGQSRAFLWQNGTMTDLQDLISPDSGWVLSEAWDINDSGQIVGSGSYNGQERAFLLTPSGELTPAGTNVVSQPLDTTTGTTPVTLTFDEVAQAGTTSLSTTSTASSPPLGFHLGNPPTYYELTTTAVFSGSVTVCIDYSGVTFDNESNLKLFHFEGGAWVDHTISLDTTNNIICANVTSLSLFAVFEPPDQLPVANAGPDQIVNEGTLVTLDGSGSSDPEGDPLTYQWTQIAGPSVTLNLADPVHPTFAAPSVPAGGATLTFQLTVSDGQLISGLDAVNITVKNVNHPPVADAGADHTVNEGSPVMLDGSASYDSDGESLSHSWVQTTGPSVTLSDLSAAKPSFIAPLVGPAGATLTFELTASDGIDSATDTVNVIIENINHPPTANAGADQTKNEGSLVTLDGTASSDPDGDPLTYAWTQLSGPAVTLSDPSSPTPTFTAPLVSLGGATLVFQLVASDGLGASATDQVTITVLNINDPPACELAQVTPALLWPPNHKLVPVGITGVSDPDNDQVTLAVTGVTQDEPVNGLGDGDTSPDAVTQGNQVLLRAERAGNGNGRVYQVTFTASDGFGGSCTGTVTVCAPRDRGAAGCVDSGQLYNSLQP